MTVKQKDLNLYVNLRKQATCRRLFYNDSLTKLKRQYIWIDGILSFVSGGTLLGLAAWKVLPEIFLVVFSSFLAVVVLAFTILKTTLKYPEKIDRYNKLVNTYWLMNSQFEELEFTLARTSDMTSNEFIQRATTIWRAKDQSGVQEDPDIDDRSGKSPYPERAEKILQGILDLEYRAPVERVPQIKNMEGELNAI